MFDQIQQILKKENIFSHLNAGITIATVANQHEGYGLAKKILYGLLDRKTVLYLSGGNTPKVLLEQLAHEEQLIAGAVGMVDERFGPKFHDKSNEEMMSATGFLRYLQMRDIPFYPILTVISSISEKSSGDLSSQARRDDTIRKKTAQAYDEKLRTLNSTYQKSVAILGIGSDGHTAGLPALSSKVKIHNAKLFEEKYDLVTEYHDTIGSYGERVTMSFVALSMLDLLIVLAFGEEKKKPLKQMFTDGSEEEIPARFFTRPDIAKKTILLSDQQI